MSNQQFGRHSVYDSHEKQSPKLYTRQYSNNLTRRNAALTQMIPSQAVSTSLLSANVKSLRLFRHICRLLPFIIRVQELQQKVTPVQSKRYCANAFRENAKQKNLEKIDYLIKYGYQTTFEAEMNYCNSGYLYRYIVPDTHKYRDFGVNKFYEKKADRINQKPDTKFLQGFYRGRKTHAQ